MKKYWFYDMIIIFNKTLHRNIKPWTKEQLEEENVDEKQF